MSNKKLESIDDVRYAQLGQEVDDFSFKAFVGGVNGKFEDLKLSDFRGKWTILFFYPADFTFVCPTELTGVAREYTTLQNLGAEVLAVSSDSHFVHMMWQKYELSKMVEGGLPYPMVADDDGKMGRYFNVYNSASGKSYRGTFIIDPNGVLQSIEANLNNVGRNVKELVRKVQAFKYSRENGGAIPCEWEPGDEVLQEGEALVGHVADTWKVKK
ncbi:redoxin domain-containing protein [Calditrichota bacterium]